MAFWPFGKKNPDTDKTDNTANDNGLNPAQNVDGAAEGNQVPEAEAAVGSSSADTAAQGQAPAEFAHDAVNSDMGPFDGDNVRIEDFDFSDFSVGILDLGSMRIPLPKDSQVQVEMGEQGPKMLHIVTRHGRMTPVAFAAPRKPGQWLEAVEEIQQGMTGDGLPARVEQGTWGPEVVGGNDNGEVRVIGADGPRWMLRLTLAAPKGQEKELAELGREVFARSFVYRGSDPILAGNPLQVTMPSQLVAQVQQAMQERQQQAAGQQTAGSAADARGHREAEQQLDNLQQQQDSTKRD